MSAREWQRVQSAIWHLVELDGGPVLAHVEVTLELRDGRQMFGMGGVNRYFGSYVHDGERFETPRIASERKAGPVDAMTQEARFLELLDAVDTIRLEDDQLVLLVEGRGVLRFVAGP